MVQPSKKHPPFLLHLLAVFFILAFLVNIAGASQTIQSWNWLLAVGYFPHPVYTLFKTVLIALIAVFAAIVLWLRLPLAPRFCQVSGVLVFAWYWFDRLALTRNPLPFTNHLFPLLISVLLMLFVLVSSWLLEPYMKGPEQASVNNTGG